MSASAPPGLFAAANRVLIPSVGADVRMGSAEVFFPGSESWGGPGASRVTNTGGEEMVCAYKRCSKTIAFTPTR